MSPLSFTEFRLRTERFVEELKALKPLAIIHMGSSVYECDYIPGVSDLDLYVISEHQIDEVDPDLGAHCWSVAPNEFVSLLANGNSFALCAMLRGRIAFDPQQFVERIQSLASCGFSLAPSRSTMNCCAQSLGNQLSMALDCYYQPEDSPDTSQRIVRRLAKAVESLAMARLMETRNIYTTGHTALRAELIDAAPTIVAALDDFRARLLQPLQNSNRSLTLISDKHYLGRAIVQAERIRSNF